MSDTDDYKKYKEQMLKDKKPKEKKVFSVGDVVICLNNKEGKLPPDALDFLLTFKKFKVLQVNDKLNIDVGHKTAEGNPFFFAPNRFELANGKAPIQKGLDIDKEDKEREVIGPSKIVWEPDPEFFYDDVKGSPKRTDTGVKGSPDKEQGNPWGGNWWEDPKYLKNVVPPEPKEEEKPKVKKTHRVANSCGGYDYYTDEEWEARKKRLEEAKKKKPKKISYDPCGGGGGGYSSSHC